MNNDLKKRVNTFMSNDVYSYVKQTSSEMGMSISAFINLCVVTYRNAQEVTSLVAEFKKLNDELKQKK